MPQMNKGGKFVFGKSLLRQDLTIHLPPQALAEYGAATEGKVFLFTGSKSTGGFCVTRKGLPEPSKLGHILAENPALQQYQTVPGQLIPYKGRAYCWVDISEQGVIQLSQSLLHGLSLEVGMQLLSIRSSNIAFTMGARGPLLERSYHFHGEIALY